MLPMWLFSIYLFPFVFFFPIITIILVTPIITILPIYLCIVLFVGIRILTIAFSCARVCFISPIVGWRRISADLLADSAAVQALMGHTLADQRISSSRARTRTLYTLPQDTDCFLWYTNRMAIKHFPL